MGRACLRTSAPLATVKLGAMLGWQGHVGQNVLLCGVHEGELRQLRAHLAGDQQLHHLPGRHRNSQLLTDRSLNDGRDHLGIPNHEFTTQGTGPIFREHLGRDLHRSAERSNRGQARL